MADINEIYGVKGDFLKTSDIPKGQIIDVTIKSTEIKTIGDKNKLVLGLDNGKAFVMNTTNAKQLASNLEELDYTKWVGKKFKIFRTTTQYQGGTVECLRVV
jgi:hypothetical protein